MPKSMIHSCFFFKASRAQELMEGKTGQSIQVKAVKVIQMSAQQFRNFFSNLLRDMPVNHCDLKLQQPRSQRER